MKKYMLLLAPLILGAGIPPAAHTGDEPSPLDRIAIGIQQGSRHFCYTNKSGAFFYGETGNGRPTGWEGFTVEGLRVLDDYALVIEGVPLDRGRSKATVFPDFLRREYPGGIIEELRPVDSLAAVVVSVSSLKPVELKFIPYLSGGRSASDFESVPGGSSLVVARRSHLKRTARENYPAWIAFCSPGSIPATESAVRNGSYSPGFLAHPRGRMHVVAVAAGDSREGALILAQNAAGEMPRLSRERRERMERLLSSTSVVTSDDRYTRALAWTKLSLDALTVSGGGIYAGLPWFNDYWGRDTFISLPGEALVTGRFAEARRILGLFASFQQRDSLSGDYGRIPNRVTSTDTAYNTADGTPRFVMMVREYAERSGDRRFPLTIYPVILRSIEGTLRYHTDTLGFLTHGEAETWMDAVGPGGPWSPRGNRANDIQALWAAQLGTGEYFATLIGDVTSARRWHDALVRLRGNFRRYFVTPGGIADRLRADGSADMTLRPNQLFAAGLLDDRERAHMIAAVVSRLTYAYGVASLSQEDSAFHPYHEYPPFYPKDAAYHNGTVWTWLQGPLISLLCGSGKEEVAWEITENSVHQILERGAAGTQSELLDAIPRPGENEPRLSGTFSQAWNLAEFIRNFYDDYAGVKFNRLTRVLTLEPALPRALGSVSFRVNAADEAVSVAVRRHVNGDQVQISTEETRDTITVRALVHVSGQTSLAAETSLPPRAVLRMEYGGGRLLVTCNGAEWPARITGRITPEILPRDLHVARPVLREGLRALRLPGYSLLSHDLIMRTNKSARRLIDEAQSAGGDATPYSYPRNPAFVPGSFNLRRFTLAADSALAYFTLSYRALSDPGWHPEYGFQLTFAAIAIHENRPGGSRASSVGRNAGVLLDSAHAYDRVIYVGGGVQVEDARGNILAAYRPVAADAVRPFGDAASGTIRFALPLSLLGDPGKGWTITVLSGAQEDHGGSGLGEFRTVSPEQGEWNGGGKLHPGDPNIYDTVVAHTREADR